MTHEEIFHLGFVPDRDRDKAASFLEMKIREKLEMG